MDYAKRLLKNEINIKMPGTHNEGLFRKTSHYGRVERVDQ